LRREGRPGGQAPHRLRRRREPAFRPGGELRTQLRASLPQYMIPAAFVLLDAFPLTPNGKVDRKALPAPQAERQIERVLVAPRSELEQRIATVWREVLHLEHVGVKDNFFDLGGHSLLIVEDPRPALRGTESASSR